MSNHFTTDHLGPILVSLQELAHVDQAGAPILPDGDRCHGHRIVKVERKRPTLPILISEQAEPIRVIWRG